MKGFRKYFSNGAEWVRADFHLHTRADLEFSYTGTDENYVPEYVGRLMAADICLGVITNHNKFDLSEYSRLSSYAANRGIYLLPGVELSVGEGASGVHVLIVFDSSWIDDGEDRISGFISSQFKGVDQRDYQRENARSTNSLAQTVADLNRYGKPYFLIFAHVEESKGLWKEMPTRLCDWNRVDWQGIRSRVLGFQNVRTNDATKTSHPDRMDRQKVRAKIGADNYPAEVEGSDPKSIAEIGSHGYPCYVKIGEYSFEAVRFALESKSLRVAQSVPLCRHSYVRSVNFSGGLMDGQTVRFSSSLNTLIGVRGSGKSAVVECLRYALDMPFVEGLIDGQYKRGLVSHVLGSGGKVTVEAIDAFGQPYRVSRILGNQPEVFRGDERQPPGISIGEVVVKHPLCFGQKELSARDESSENDLLERLIGSRLSAVRAEIAQKKQEIRVFWAPMTEVDNPQEKIADVKGAISTIDAQLAIYNTLDVAENLQEKVDLDHDHLWLVRADVAIDQFISACERGISENVDSLHSIVAYQPRREHTFWSEYREAYDQFLSAVEDAKRNCRTLRDAYARLHGLLDKHQGLIASQSERFARVERDLSERLAKEGHAKVRPDEYVQLKKRSAVLKQSLIELNKAQATRTARRQRLVGMIAELQDLYQKEFQLAWQEIEKINAASSSLKISYTYRGNHEAFLNHMTATFRGTGVRNAVYSRLVEQFSDYYQCYLKFKDVRDIIGDKADAFAERFCSQILDLLTWQVPNKTAIMFKGKPLVSHSLGQRASALVLFVMSLRENDIIIIDQPEDDLDSQTIYEDVIKLVLKLKPNVQFIFATHNANVPVLGDAEQVIACNYSGAGIKFDLGSLDVKKQQRHIIEIMEGGTEAFGRRKEIYGQWNAVT